MVQYPHQHSCKFLNPPCHYYLRSIIDFLIIKNSIMFRFDGRVKQIKEKSNSQSSECVDRAQTLE